LLGLLHTTLGLLHDATWGPQCSIKNLQKALWLYSRNHSSNVVEIGMSSHRLALACSSAGRYDEARSLLQAALGYYEQDEANLGKYHPFVVVARDGLERSAVDSKINIGVYDYYCDDDNTTTASGTTQDRSPKLSSSPSTSTSTRRLSLKGASYRDWASLPKMPPLAFRLDEDSRVSESELNGKLPPPTGSLQKALDDPNH
jgi:tetratricopeptide (TPR) repeat protein